MIDLTGQSFGHLTVIERAGSERRSVTWLCRCNCGAETIVRGDNLRSGRTRSCSHHLHGGHRGIDLVGQRFGELIVIERAAAEDLASAWRCRCNCGFETVVRGDNLRGGKTLSCGHLQAERMKGWKNWPRNVGGQL
jgi:hypothetical protein